MFNWVLTSYLLKVLVRLQEWLQRSGAFLMIMKQNCKCWRSETRTILNLIYVPFILFGPFFSLFYICECLRQPTWISTLINFMDQLPILQLFLVFLFNMAPYLILIYCFPVLCSGLCRLEKSHFMQQAQLSKKYRN